MMVYARIFVDRILSLLRLMMIMSDNNKTVVISAELLLVV